MRTNCKTKSHSRKETTASPSNLISKDDTKARLTERFAVPLKERRVLERFLATLSNESA